ncbi:MAG TPA: hypothetical protein VJN70_11995 [Gemmatimonadaceae bacterium]|nr:hypothetical protein [Gemmatimonadaceae bacterium]
MYRQRPTQLKALSFLELEDAQDLRSVIAAALAATPVDEESLRRGVWTYVCAERDVGVSPGTVIFGLTQLVDASPIRVPFIRHSVMRRVILWCVEAYFDYLGGEAVDGGEDAPPLDPVATPPMIVSNR